MSDSDTDCVFCKIIRRELPAEIVYEDEHFLGFLDIHPQSPGHVQLVPKKHYRWVWDVPEAGAYFEVARKIAQAQQKAFGTDAVFSRIMGDEIFHAHIWLFPNPKQAVGDPKNVKENAEKLKAAL